MVCHNFLLENKIFSPNAFLQSGEDVSMYGAILFAFALFERTVFTVAEQHGVSVLTILERLKKLDHSIINLEALIWIQLNVRNNLVHGSFEKIEKIHIKPAFTVIKQFVEAHASVLEPKVA